VKYVFAIGSLGGFNGTLTPYYPTITAHNPPYGGGQYCSLSSLGWDSSPGTFTLSMTVAACNPWTFDVLVRLTTGTIIRSVTVQLYGVTTGIFSLSTPAPPPSVSAAGTPITLPIHVTSKFNGQIVYFPVLQFPPLFPTCTTVTGNPAASVAAPGDTSLILNTAVCPQGAYTAIVTAQSTLYQTVPQSLALPFVVGPNSTPPISPSSPRPPP
jgi:hypothetical protein